MAIRTNSLVWKLHHPLCSEPSYLFGTMHVRDERVFHMESKIRDLILQCNVYAAETNLNDLIKQKWTPSLRYDGASLKESLGPKKFEKVRSILVKAFQFDIGHYERFHPFMILNRIAESALGKQQQVTLDHHLWNIAQTNEMELTGVESMEEQIEIMHQMDPSEFVKMICKIASNVRKFNRQIQRLIHYYENQDLRMILKATKRSLGSNKKIHLLHRNRRMTDRIEKMIGGQSHFVAIGAAHLHGKHGVIRSLKLMGIKVSPH